MKARLLIFPVKGRKWCFAKSLDHQSSPSQSDPRKNPQTLKDVFRKISSSRNGVGENVEIVADFVSDKMVRAWDSLGKAPVGSMKEKIYGLGHRLLTRVQPSEMFLKSINKDVTQLEVTFPASLNPRLVRRRLRHIAIRGSTIHKKYFYGSVTLLPFTAIFVVLPLPNVPFFWILFRAYSHWRALQGSNRLILLASDCPKLWTGAVPLRVNSEAVDEKTHNEQQRMPLSCPLVLEPSRELEKYLLPGKNHHISDSVAADICRMYNLDVTQVLKFRDP